MLIDDFKRHLPDIDPQETEEWLEGFESVIDSHGVERARFIIRKLVKLARLRDVGSPALVQTPFINTISPEQEPPYPGDESIERRIRRLIRWNAAVMVVKANRNYPGIGGHLASYASAATLLEVGFNHFFRGKDDGQGDQIFFQGHSAPGIYARSFLEGRLSLHKMERFRREVERGKGLSSYPHPRLMPDYWEYPSVSMGLSPHSAIYQARFNRYLHAQGIANTENSRVWSFVGDGETDEPETLGALSFAAREGLDNLTFVVNCNLQRLDGPVRGNGKIIQELESVFRGAGWNVIKVVWGRQWDPLLQNDVNSLLLSQMNDTVDGQFQKYSVESGAYIREKFFGTDPRLLDLVSHLSDEDLTRLRRGGHDYRKVYAAYDSATRHRGQPTVILAHTVKGWTLGEGFEASNVTHQMKKLDEAELRAFRDRLQLPIPDSELPKANFYHPGKDSEEVEYMLERRRQLGGLIPRRLVRPKSLDLPDHELYAEFEKGSGEQQVSTTMATVRLLTKLLRHKGIGKRIVPIVPDEARTFGMEPLFQAIGIYSSRGQLYEPVDRKQLLHYKESKTGQMLEEGITESGSMGSFLAAGTSYAAHGEPMIPFYFFYSMFGFQRTGDQIWAFGDARGKGFLLGATAGRTTLNGEGLQHQDGHSHVLAATVPKVVAYDPAFAFEIATIIRDGLRRMYHNHEECFYYITVHNENYTMHPMPEDSSDGILRGMYVLERGQKGKGGHVTLLGSGSILKEVLRAKEILEAQFGIGASVLSATSYQQLRKEALQVERWNRLNPEQAPRESYVHQLLSQFDGPFVAASDFMKLVPDQIRQWVPGTFDTLGTDGFGMSDTRQALRRHFEVDAESIVITTLYRLSQEGALSPEVVTKAIRDFDYDPEKIDALEV